MFCILTSKCASRQEILGSTGRIYDNICIYIITTYYIHQHTCVYYLCIDVLVISLCGRATLSRPQLKDNPLYTYYIHIIYILCTYYIHIIYILYTYYIHIVYITYIYIILYINMIYILYTYKYKKPFIG